MLVLFFSFLTAFVLTYLAIPSIIHIARRKQLYDEPSFRSAHIERTPSLGGIAIFAGSIFSIVYWTPFNEFGNLQYILCALLLLFLIGAKDDISPVSPSNKLVGQIMAASILILKSDIHLDSFYGLLGFHAELITPFCFFISVLTILVIINAINFIDGLDGLAGSLFLLMASSFGVWFYVTEHWEFVTIAFASVGAVMAFLKYNFSPAQIFMGDTGSLILGTILAILAINFISINHELAANDPFKLQGGPVLAISILIVPLFDMIRVFITRLLRAQSLFQADRRHIHHLLLDAGLSHIGATSILFLLNMLIITLAFSLHNKMNMHGLLVLELGIISVFTYSFHIYNRNQNKKKYTKA